MESKPWLDSGKPFDWGRTSSDYADYRPWYPESFWTLLRAVGIGGPKQAILDLATDPGVLALPLAETGSVLTGIDIAQGQITTARALAEKRGIDATFLVGDAHETCLDAAQFDVITASMCMHYFDPERIIPEIHRLLVRGGRLVVASLLYLPRESDIASASERLVLKHNPTWGSAGFGGEVSIVPKWADGRFRLLTFHRYVEQIRVTVESWCGRFRACRGVAASMSDTQVAQFDAEHQAMLRQMTDGAFDIPHLVTLHVFEPLESG